MTNANDRRWWCRAALAGAFGMALLIGFSDQKARAEDDEYELPDVKIMRHIMKGLGLRRGDESGPDYQERPPLVLPNNLNLPPPETKTAAKAPDWPNDPDVARARKMKLDELKVHSHVEGVDDRPLRPGEFPNAPPPGRDDGRPRKSLEESYLPMSLKELGAKSIFNLNTLWGSGEEYGTFAGEPPRTSLTEPPKGYRTPSPAQPYGVGKEKWIPKAASTADRHVPPPN